MRKISLMVSLVALLGMGAIACDNNPDVRGLPTNNKVVIVGDSIFALSGDIKRELANLARENYRGYALSGAEMVGGFRTPVPAQYTKARRADSNIRTMVMDGGGNDILIGGQSQCKPYGPACQAILDEVYGAMDILFARMNADGVQNLVYLGYYHVKGGSAALNPVLDIGMADFIDICDDSPVDCYFVDPRNAFSGHLDWIKSDGIHPTGTGSSVLAGLLWTKMQDNGIEQNQ